MIKGSYAKDEITFLGTIGEIGIGCIPVVGQIAYVREIVYDVQNWEWSWSNKEIGSSIKKGVKSVPEFWNNFKKGTEEFLDKIVGKGVNKNLNNVDDKTLKNVSKETKEALESVIKQPQNSFKNITEQIKNTNGNIDTNLGIANKGKGVEINNGVSPKVDEIKIKPKKEEVSSNNKTIKKDNPKNIKSEPEKPKNNKDNKNNNKKEENKHSNRWKKRDNNIIWIC